MPSGLTTRGRCLLAGGVAAALCALVLDERDLLRIAAFVVFLPLLATLVATRARVGLEAQRHVEPERTPAGTPCEVRLTVSSTGRLGSGGLLLSDGVPPVLGRNPRFVVERLPRQSSVLLRHPLRPAQRGVHVLGPLVARVTDPFGLAEYGRELAGHQQLVVTPVVVPLTGLLPGGGSGSGEEGAGRLRSGPGEDDVVVRSYRQGDDLRKVHWRSTARHDELMVRVEERPWRGGTCVLLDSRAAAHRGTGPTASLEYAVSLAASVCLHLQHRGQRVALTTGDGQSLGGPADSSPDAVLDALAALTPSHRRELVAGSAAAGRDVLAVLGAVTPAVLEPLLRARPRGLRSAAVLLDVAAWDRGGAHTDPEEAAQLLASTGWAVTVAGPEDSLTEAWTQLCTRPSTRLGALR